MTIGDALSNAGEEIRQLENDLAAAKEKIREFRNSRDLEREAKKHIESKLSAAKERERVLEEVLKELRDAVKASGKMNGQEYDGLGIKVNATLERKKG